MLSPDFFDRYAGKKRKRGQENESARKFRYLLVAYSEQHGLCFWCHRPMPQPGLYHKGVARHDLMTTHEHLIPRSRGGGTTFLNTVAAHAICNQKRGNPDVGAE
jgi:5-methylcytosine-specific restriction endonuclease McrA